MHLEKQEEWYLKSTNKNLDEHLRNELNREEPPCRTPVTKEWRDKIEGWKNKIKSCGDLDGGSDEMAEGIWTPEKKRWKTLGTRIYSSRTNSEERDYSLGEIRIRFIVCLSFIKLNWWQAMDLAYYLFP